LERAYQDTIENSPNVARVERVLSEPFPIVIGKMDVYNNKLVYTKIYPRKLSKEEKSKVNLLVMQIKELKDTINYLENLLKSSEDLEFYKRQINSFVHLKNWIYTFIGL
jgi:hypothetical protein